MVSEDDGGDRTVTITLTTAAINDDAFELGESYSLRVQIVFDNDPETDDEDNFVGPGRHSRRPRRRKQ